MRWTIRIALALLILFAVYSVWPFWGLYKLAHAVEMRDAAAVNGLVDYKELRNSLGAQIVRSYMRLTGQDRRFGSFTGGIAVGLGVSIADPLLAKLVTPEALLDLLQKGWPEGAMPDGAAPTFSGIRPDALGSVWGLYANAEYSGLNFSVALPVSSPPAQQFRLRLRLSGWEWKLVGVDLPEGVTTRLAQNLIKASGSNK